MARVPPSHEMAKAHGFYPVTNKLEYMQAPAWVSRDGGGHKGKSKGKGGGKPRSYGKKATATRVPAAAPPPNTSAHGATSHEAEIKYDRCDKLFRFGGGKTLPSTVCVSFPVKVFNTVRQLTVYLIDSDAPLLIARPTLEAWGIVCGFRNKRIQLLDEPELGWKTLP